MYYHDEVSVLVDEPALQAAVKRLGEQITKDYQGKDLLMVGILKGAVVFMTDLIRQIDLPLSIDFMAVSSYGDDTHTSGVVKLNKDLDKSITGRHVIIVEDIVDSGLTLKYLKKNLLARKPASVRICTLLDKVSGGHEGIITPDYIGIEIPDAFVVGYGLDYAERYRNLPYIGILDPSKLKEPV